MTPWDESLCGTQPQPLAADAARSLGRCYLLAADPRKDTGLTIATVGPPTRLQYKIDDIDAISWANCGVCGLAGGSSGARAAMRFVPPTASGRNGAHRTRVFDLSHSARSFPSCGGVADARLRLMPLG